MTPSRIYSLLLCAALVLIITWRHSSVAFSFAADRLSDSSLKETLTPTFQKIRKKYDRKYNDMGRYLAGMLPEKGCVLDTALLNHPDWKLYHDTADLNWQKYYTERVLPLREWSYDEMGELNSKPFKFFYPFSGPDVLHGNMFFQNADTTIMFGLEAVGYVPLQKTTNRDSVSSYIKSINHSLYAVLNFSFFRTLAMRKDLTSAGTGGTLPLLMLLLERTGNRVLDVKGINIDKKGKPVKDELGKHKAGKVPGVEITYCRSDSTHEAKLFYFRVDISNSGMYYKTPEFSTYLKNMGEVYTLIKSASYLMHTEDFSAIRSLILKQSRIVLQDDSGIPHNYFTKHGFEHTLYGNYTGVISLFSSKFQSSLDKAYKSDPAKVKPISFGIGYKYQPGESNWVLYRKPKSPAAQ
ncbi:MAG: hypothetical protein AB1458_09620 [Bacteroidota bacterium]